MSEVEKMYMRCEIKKQQNCSHTDTCYNGSLDECEGCNLYQYPPFTAEKQLKLIKWLINFDYTHLSKLYGADINFSVVLAATINYLWKCLSKSEQEQIRSILNG